MYLCSIHCVTLHLLNMLPRLIHVIACSCNSFIFIAGKSYKYTTTNVSHLLMIIWVVSILLNTNKCYAHSYSYIRCTHTEVLLWYISQSLEFLSHTSTYIFNVTMYFSKLIHQFTLVSTLYEYPQRFTFFPILGTASFSSGTSIWFYFPFS